MTVSVNPVQKQDSDFDQILRAVQVAGSLFSDFKSHKESAAKLAADMAKEKAAGERQSQLDANAVAKDFTLVPKGQGDPNIKIPGRELPEGQEYALKKPQDSGLSLYQAARLGYQNEEAKVRRKRAV